MNSTTQTIEMHRGKKTGTWNLASASMNKNFLASFFNMEFLFEIADQVNPVSVIVAASPVRLKPVEFGGPDGLEDLLFDLNITRVKGGVSPAATDDDKQEADDNPLSRDNAPVQGKDPCPKALRLGMPGIASRNAYFAYISRNRVFRTLPVALRGSSDTNATDLGFL
jgi:hypothetical protein